MTSTRYFHTADILTVLTGRVLAPTNPATPIPGGEADIYDAPMDGLINIIEHVAGVKLRHPLNPNKYDGGALLENADQVTAALAAQFPKIAEVCPEEKNCEGVDALQAWVKTVEDRFGVSQEVKAQAPQMTRNPTHPAPPRFH